MTGLEPAESGGDREVFVDADLYARAAARAAARGESVEDVVARILAEYSGVADPAGE
ncbi:hypothetical protein [Glaciihabitans sp. dw_435]|uniref:hypothetical protein n=1 Tax=Glaciihabitans sp. dw_435 TaxID=2720081 RepID=UPI001BD317E1|nr:hypothetical protein [Glaciihabitans sp. dw_435]